MGGGQLSQWWRRGVFWFSLVWWESSVRYIYPAFCFRLFYGLFFLPAFLNYLKRLPCGLKDSRSMCGGFWVLAHSSAVWVWPGNSIWDSSSLSLIGCGLVSSRPSSRQFPVLVVAIAADAWRQTLGSVHFIMVMQFEKSCFRRSGHKWGLQRALLFNSNI